MTPFTASGYADYAPLTRIELSLFDWTTGEEVEFTMENFHAMARRKEEMDEFKS